MAEELFSPEFIADIRAKLPKAEENLRLAEARAAVGKAAGADMTEVERQIFTLRTRLAKIKSAFHLS